MSDRKYTSDYVLEEHLGPDGKLQTNRIYRGTYYRFIRPQTQIRQLGSRLLIMSALVLVLMLPLLFNNSQIGRTFYVLLPMAFVLIPLYQLAAVGWRLKTWELPLTRQQKDLTQGRLHQALPWLAALLALDTLGCGIYWLRNGRLETGEIFCVLGICLACALAARLQSWRTLADTEEIS